MGHKYVTTRHSLVEQTYAYGGKGEQILKREMILTPPHKEAVLINATPMQIHARLLATEYCVFATWMVPDSYYSERPF